MITYSCLKSRGFMLLNNKKNKNDGNTCLKNSETFYWITKTHKKEELTASKIYLHYNKCHLQNLTHFTEWQKHRNTVLKTWQLFAEWQIHIKNNLLLEKVWFNWSKRTHITAWKVLVSFCWVTKIHQGQICWKKLAAIQWAVKLHEIKNILPP